MFLRSLTLKGFKSFAESTTLEFEPGVTVVVGPNGSGKSNIVDAVAWVLGALGPRTVRSTRMDDVIFAGGGNRPALGRAEVTLTIDNAAGLLPIELTEVTITRTLFRASGESEYAINGVPCRLLDVQELLSDTGVGRQQHVIVSQGQLDAVLESRPEDRRLIIEEAAGILKYRRRKERAQRRLDATEVNLVRLADLLKEVRRQLRPLERQAEAARRHDGLADELAALRRYLAGRELAGLAARLDAATASQGLASAEESKARRVVEGLDVAVASAEAWLAGADPAGLTDLAGRYEAMRQRGRGVAAVLAERRRSIERERAATVDSSVLAALQADADRLAEELRLTETETTEAGEHLKAVTEQMAPVEAERAGLGSDSRAAPRGAAEARGELAALEAGAERARAAIARQQRRLADLRHRAAELETLTVSAEAAHAEARRVRDVAAAVVEQVEARCADLAGPRDAAETTRVAALGEMQRWTARAEALALALAHHTNDEPGDDLFATADAVLGRLHELVDVDPGWEAAFEAAVGDILAALVVDGCDPAREMLAGAGATGRAVLALGAPIPQSSPSAASGVGEPLSARVRPKLAALGPALDALLQKAVVVDGEWGEALDAVLANPGVVAVTRRGDRFSASGWRLGPAGSSGARAALKEARQGVEEASVKLSRAEAALFEADAALSLAVEEREQAVAQLARADAGVAGASQALTRAQNEWAEASTRVEAVQALLEEQADDLASATARLAEHARGVAVLESEEQAGAEALAATQIRRAELDERLDLLRRARAEHEMRVAALSDRRTFLADRLADVQGRLADATARAGVAPERAVDPGTAATTDRLAAMVADRLALLETRLVVVQDRRDRLSVAVRATAGRLDQLRRERSAAERGLEETRERVRRTELDEAEARMRLEAATERVRRELDCEPADALAVECPPLAPGVTATTRARQLERELRLLGPVNPLAIEELTALEERHVFLAGQLDDVKASRRDLAKLIRAVDSEMEVLLRAAWADVADHFTALFGTLFPGGEGRLRLSDPDNLLESGIEIDARPAGKKIRQLSLLSGGERSLCALAFLFAVFRSRPSPFYLLDEVEAALDDVNLHRFLGLLEEFRQEAQLLVVTHQKRTMEAADCLYGVTMQSGGTSRVLSERVRATA